MSVLVRSAGLTGYEALASSLGVNVERELRRAGLSRRLLANPDGLIPYVALIKLLERTARIAQAPDFGLRLAQMQDLAILGPVAVLIRHAATFGDALRLASQYLFAHSPGARFTVQPVPEQPDLVDLSFRLDLPHLPPCSQTLENALGIVAQGVRLLAPEGGRPVLALLPHARIGPLASYRLTYGCPCRFEAAGTTALRLASAALRQPLREHNPVLQQLAQSFLEQQRGARGADEAVVAQVRGLLRRFIGMGQGSLEDIAELMVLHPRTLQRRLSDEGRRFAELLDEVRREQLLDLLGRRPGPPLAQVAQMLGYAEQGALTRVTRRWFGCTPSELRRREQTAESVA